MADIEIQSWKRSYQLVRCFGDLISQLSVKLRPTISSDGPKSISHADQLITYINEYCAETLTEIQMKYVSPATLNHLGKTFPMVTKVVFETGAPFDNNILRRLFPNVRSLIFVARSQYADFTGINNHFPYLDHVELCTPFKQGFKKIPESSTECAPIYSFLHMNPQLRSLKVPFILNEDFLRTVNEIVPNLRSLSRNDHFDSLSTYNGPTVHFKHVNKLEMNLFIFI